MKEQSISKEQEKADRLIVQTKRLEVFTRTFKGRWCPAVEGAAYSVLEVYQSRPRALWRYFRYALRHWRYMTFFNIRFYVRLFYLRLHGHERNAAIERICEALEEKYSAGGK